MSIAVPSRSRAHLGTNVSLPATLGSPLTRDTLIRLNVSLLTETVRVVGIISILFLVGTLRVFHRHGRVINGNLFEVFARALFTLAAVAGIVTAGFRFSAAITTPGESLTLAIVWAVFIVFLPTVITPWVRARRSGMPRAEVRDAFTSAVQMSLSTGLLTWVFLVLTGRSGRLLDLRLFIAAAIVTVGAVQLARLRRVPRFRPPPEPLDPEPDKVPVGS
jgi:hypothetical protein